MSMTITNSSSKLRNNKLIFVGIFAIMVVVFIGSLTFLKNVYQTETYYELSASVQSNQQITPQMLKAVTTSKGTGPVNVTAGGPTIGLAQVQQGNVYSRYPIGADELLTTSNTTSGQSDISAGIPDNWLVTDFTAPADSAEGGTISRGYYFDIMIVDKSNGVWYPFIHVLCLQSSSSSTVSAATTGNPSATSYYYVGLPIRETAILQSMVAQYGGSMKLILSARQDQYQAPSQADYAGIFKYSINASTGPNSAPSASSTVINPDDQSQSQNAGTTDPSFAPVARDNKGVPCLLTDRTANPKANAKDPACVAAKATK